MSCISCFRSSVFGFCMTKKDQNDLCYYCLHNNYILKNVDSKVIHFDPTVVLLALMKMTIVDV